MTLGNRSLRLAFRMVEFKATQPTGGALARSDSSEIIISIKLGIHTWLSSLLAYPLLLVTYRNSPPLLKTISLTIPR